MTKWQQELGAERSELSAEQELGPRNDTEALLCELWMQALGVPVNALDDFFQLGGDSILTVGIVARARAHGLELTGSQFFATPDRKSVV